MLTKKNVLGLPIAMVLMAVVIAAAMVAITISNVPTITSASVGTAPLTYDKNTILCNHDFSFANSLSQAEIQAIFDSRNSFFRNYTDPTQGKSASWIVFNRAENYNISSRILLSMMQKESSSVWFYKDMNEHIFKDGEDMGTRADWVLFFSWTDTTVLTKYKGFYNQVDNAARSLSEWFANPGSKGWAVGYPHSVGDGEVTPTNRATAALYIYSPWISSNKLYYDVWKMMLGDTGMCSVSSPTNFKGTVVSQTQIKLSWSDVANEQNYDLWRVRSGSSWEFVATLSENTVTYNDTGLSSETWYKYAIRAYRGSTTSVWTYSNWVKTP